MITLLIGYMWMEIHRPFEVWTWLATFRVERVYAIVTIVYWLTSRPALRPNRLNRRFAWFVGIMLLSWLLSPFGSAGNDVVENYLKCVVFYVMLVTSVRDERDLRRIIRGYLAVMALFMAHSLREFYCGRARWEQGTLRLCPVCISIDFNDYAGLIVCSLPFAWAFWRESSDWRQRALLCGYFGLACYSIVLTGSRMGFAGMVLASMMACLASPQRWRLLALYPVIMVAAWGFLPAGMKDRYITLFDPDYKSVHGVTNNNFRIDGFERGYRMMEERKLLGYGPNGVGAYAGNGMMAHNLYGQLLGELGIAGAIAFAGILFGVGQNTSEARRMLRDMGGLENLLPWYTILAAAATFILLAIMSWGFNFLFFFVWLWFGGFQVVAMQCLEQAAENPPLGQYDEWEHQAGSVEQS